MAYSARLPHSSYGFNGTTSDLLDGTRSLLAMKGDPAPRALLPPQLGLEAGPWAAAAQEPCAAWSTEDLGRQLRLERLRRCERPLASEGSTTAASAQLGGTGCAAHGAALGGGTGAVATEAALLHERGRAAAAEDRARRYEGLLLQLEQEVSRVGAERTQAALAARNAEAAADEAARGRDRAVAMLADRERAATERELAAREQGAHELELVTLQGREKLEASVLQSRREEVAAAEALRRLRAELERAERAESSEAAVARQWERSQQAAVQQALESEVHLQTEERLATSEREQRLQAVKEMESASALDREKAARAAGAEQGELQSRISTLSQELKAERQATEELRIQREVWSEQLQVAGQQMQDYRNIVSEAEMARAFASQREEQELGAERRQRDALHGELAELRKTATEQAELAAAAASAKDASLRDETSRFEARAQALESRLAASAAEQWRADSDLQRVMTEAVKEASVARTLRSEVETLKAKSQKEVAQYEELQLWEERAAIRAGELLEERQGWRLETREVENRLDREAMQCRRLESELKECEASRAAVAAICDRAQQEAGTLAASQRLHQMRAVEMDAAVRSRLDSIDRDVREFQRLRMAISGGGGACATSFSETWLASPVPSNAGALEDFDGRAGTAPFLAGGPVGDRPSPLENRSLQALQLSPPGALAPAAPAPTSPAVLGGTPLSCAGSCGGTAGALLGGIPSYR
eukprot:TRINITY_DN13105_c0_g7_i2.p1 TRINITY_DN13105_c0_g7~~TRINITY_DN13105_c0_g7_i2.p1  ORF type:complete len:711 (+),score=186.81 TRINITY_DN13105_c0_g7_i2:180-2312(+)